MPPANHLAQETSPYLLQHKDNPVHWYPWGDAAFAAAKAENKPILLSVGYAACHWCHVMAHESFEQDAIADLMNTHFINIKVDREERPDIDLIYQGALNLLGEQGGWPLTMFLTPEGKPYWGGTYFPPEPRYDRPGFPQVLLGLSQAYHDAPDDIHKNVEALSRGLEHIAQSNAGQAITSDILDGVVQRLLPLLDRKRGGTAGAPKFPQAPLLKFLWLQGRGKDPYLLKPFVSHTLTILSQGGIYDHLGGGYARYSVDQRWLVPHFEKMLYDNAQLLDLLTWAYQDSRESLFKLRAEETVSWLLSEMRALDQNGQHRVAAFASSLDADSEGEEGRFYVWDEAEVDRLLGESSELFKHHYGVSSGGNWEGNNILNRLRQTALESPETEQHLAAARATLLEARSKRERPSWDDKVLADWNGLAISALARAALAFDRPDWLEAAKDAFTFVQTNLVQENQLQHSWRRGLAQHKATLDDYAFLSDAALALYGATFDRTYLTYAEGWLANLLDGYWDETSGGFFLTGTDTDHLPLRPKSAQDTATPSGNAVAADVLARLFYLTGNDLYRQKAEAVISAFSGDVQKHTFAFTALLSAARTLVKGIEIVVVSDVNSPALPDLLAPIHQMSLPEAVIQQVSPDDALPESHPAAAKLKEGHKDGIPLVFICQNQSCSLPLTDPQAVKEELERCLA
ncbi:thioredoxin domain-containing protein [Rhodovibrionaceae bacterium A322]